MSSTKQIVILFLALCLLATTVRRASAAESVSASGEKPDEGVSAKNTDTDGLIHIQARPEIRQVQRALRRNKSSKTTKKSKKRTKRPTRQPTPLPTPPPTPPPTTVFADGADGGTLPPTDVTSEPTFAPTSEPQLIEMQQRSLSFYDPAVETDFFDYERESEDTSQASQPIEIPADMIVSNLASCPGTKELCDLAQINDPSFKEFKQACRLLDAVNFLDFNTLDSTNQFTVFLPTNTAVTRLFEEVYDYKPNDQIPLSWIQSFLRQHIIKDRRLSGSDLYCKDRLPVITIGSHKWPTVVCKTTILNGFVPFIRGLANRGNDYLPRIRNPDNPIVLCKDIIYVVEDVILLSDP